MREVNLQQADLNLLKLLGALLEERSVTRAGMRLGLSQPAASRALGRLRHLLNDRLFVRTPQGLEPTPRALALEPSVRHALDTMRAIITPAQFDPKTAQRRFVIACVDHMTLMIMPGLIAMLQREAPGIDIKIPPARGDNVDLIATGGADISVGVFNDDALPGSLYRRKLYDTDLVCIVRRGHPVLSQNLTPELFAELSHMLITITGQGEGQVDTALAEHGLRRRIALKLPHFLAAPMLVATSDLALCTPRQLAHYMASFTAIELMELPLETGTFPVSMIWHERLQDDPAHMWLRQKIIVQLGSGSA